MHGCWLALDDQGDVRLCAQLPLDALSEMTFVQWVKGFVQQTADIPGLLNLPAAKGSAAAAPRPVSRRVF
jgi:hypothetical protein